MHAIRSLISRRLKSSQFRLLQDIRYESHLQKERLLNKLAPSRILKRNAIRDMRSIRLHWGCGGKHLEGWLNIDGWKTSAVDYVHDMRMALPLADNSAAIIFTEHVLEHFTANDGAEILKDFYRILEKGGRVRIIVPDFDIYANRKGVSDPTFSETSWRNMNRAESANDVFYGHFHRAIYDFEMLRGALIGAGFKESKISRSSFRASVHDALNQDGDGQDRIAVSLYVEAEK